MFGEPIIIRGGAMEEEEAKKNCKVFRQTRAMLSWQVFFETIGVSFAI